MRRQRDALHYHLSLLAGVQAKGARPSASRGTASGDGARGLWERAAFGTQLGRTGGAFEAPPVGSCLVMAA